MDKVLKQQPYVEPELDPTALETGKALAQVDAAQVAQAWDWREAAPHIRRRLSEKSIIVLASGGRENLFMTASGARELAALLGLHTSYTVDQRYKTDEGGVGYIISCHVFTPSGICVGSGMSDVNTTEASIKQKRPVDSHTALGLCKAYARREAMQGVASLCGLMDMDTHFAASQEAHTAQQTPLQQVFSEARTKFRGVNWKSFGAQTLPADADDALREQALRHLLALYPNGMQVANPDEQAELAHALRETLAFEADMAASEQDADFVEGGAGEVVSVAAQAEVQQGMDELASKMGAYK